ncbi:YicC/YloC family endoribonuclease [Rubellimicrobium sp. CFH 75288]|uniref:YicC/YloC family endoribonuclease n=1 Tax=Rubellimicrobium sp. CFH 75288 TaxID=2697034 RepID=UPI0014136C35|nr:YicC/YloC family endoribonuclease [Rubellimicrobium sp. CFH 75288]NAZ36915.1 YicC family protein [Rubellimicrobium sp. CFH 75288]
MIRSMTAFATASGSLEGVRWDWDLRSVNGKSLDLRLRLPDGIEPIEPSLRTLAARHLARGAVSGTLRLETEGPAAAPTIDPDGLLRALAAVKLVREQAAAAGVDLGLPSPVEILAVRGVMMQSGTTVPTGLGEAVTAGFEEALLRLRRMREVEGSALRAILIRHLDTIEALTRHASVEAQMQRDAAAVALREALGRICASVPEADPGRLEQELALIAVRSDTAEEIDRLQAHVAAARALLDEQAPVGRRLDFLAQEFHREANTLCSKSNSTGLIRVGLDLKSVIDQMREQIQNVE